IAHFSVLAQCSRWVRTRYSSTASRNASSWASSTSRPFVAASSSPSSATSTTKFSVRPVCESAAIRRKIRRASSFCEIASRDSMSSSQSGRTWVKRRPPKRGYARFASRGLSYIRGEVAADAGDAHLRSQLRSGRQTADRPPQDFGREQVPPYLDRASGGGRDPHEAAEPDLSPADDA